jgi:uncharacterized protein (TIGR03067 family)
MVAGHLAPWAVLLLIVADQPAKDAIGKEMTKLEGEWSMVSGEADGQPLPADYVKNAKRVAKDGETTVTFNGQVFMRAKFTVDASKTPKTIDYAMTEGFTKGKTQLGVYELDGDTVKFCFASPGQERPTDLKGGSGRTVSVWKRVMK